MPLTSERKLTDDESRAVAATVLEELARRRISRRLLADQAKISISTLEKALSGRRPLTLATKVRLEQALGISLLKRNSTEPADTISVAPDELGFYSRPAVSWIEGDYLTLRPSFGEVNAVYAYRTEIRWDDTRSSLIFRESERLDAAFTHHGLVSVPHQSGHIYLVTNRHGQYRLIIMTRPTISGEMYGVLATLRVGRGAELTPVGASIVFVPLRTFNNAQFGQITAQHHCYQSYRRYLKRTVDESFALFLSG